MPAAHGVARGEQEPAHLIMRQTRSSGSRRRTRRPRPRPEEVLGSSHVKRAAAGLQERPEVMRAFKKTFLTVGENRAEAAAGTAIESRFSGRDACRPERKAHLSLGQDWLASAHSLTIKSDRIHLPVRRGHALNAAPGAALAPRPATPKPCSSISTRSPPGSALWRPRHPPRDQAGWHRVPQRSRFQAISPSCRLPPRSPELILKKTSGKFMRSNWLSNRHLQRLRRYRPSRAATPGTHLSISPGKSCPSPTAYWAHVGRRS